MGIWVSVGKEVEPFRYFNDIRKLFLMILPETCPMIGFKEFIESDSKQFKGPFQDQPFRPFLIWMSKLFLNQEVTLK